MLEEDYTAFINIRLQILISHTGNVGQVVRNADLPIKQTSKRLAKETISRINFVFKQGDSANAVPHYQKLRTRVTHIWGNRKGQPIRSAMERPRPGRTSLMIKVSPVPGKYA